MIKAGFNGRCPSAAVLQSAFVAVMEGMEHWYHRQQQLVDGRNLALDDSHKVTKGIRVMNSKSSTESTLSSTSTVKW